MKKVDSKDSSKEELIKRTDIPNTPFTIIETEEKVFGCMGEYRLTEPMKNVKEVQEALKKITWNRIVQVMMILIQTKDLIKKEA